MAHTPGPFRDVASAVATAFETVTRHAAAPSPRVTQHWEAPARLTWFGAAADHQHLHASWSLGRLRGVPEAPGQPHTMGVFHLTRAAFPALDERVLRGALEALLPEGVDGATRLFLQRVAAQLAVADALLAMEAKADLQVSLFARSDAVHTPASTPRWPEHARERVAAALAQMDPVLRARCEVTWAHPAPLLLDAARSH